MSSGSLFAKASFAVLLLIFGCLVYIIVHDHRLDQERDAAMNENARPSPLTPVSMTGTSSNSPKPDAYAPLRPRPVSTADLEASRRPNADKRGAAPGPSVVLAGRTSAAPSTELPIDGSGVSYGGYAGTRAGTISPNSLSVTGVVTLRGTPPAEKQIALDPICARAHTSPMMTRHYVTGREGGLAEVFVYIKAGSVSIGPPVAQMVSLDQVGCQYQPYVTGVQAGQTLLVRNSDPFLHNVHAQATANPERNVAQRNRGITTPFVFQRREVFVRFKCDVHPWMFAYVGVVDHPWFAITDTSGRFALPTGLVPGRYTLAAVHPKAGELTQEITVTNEGVEPVSFVFDVGGLTEADTRAHGNKET